jgi:hypothetical protein
VHIEASDKSCYVQLSETGLTVAGLTFPAPEAEPEPDPLRCDVCGSENAFTDVRSYPSGVTFLGAAEWLSSEYPDLPGLRARRGAVR